MLVYSFGHILLRCSRLNKNHMYIFDYEYDLCCGFCRRHLCMHHSRVYAYGHRNHFFFLTRVYDWDFQFHHMHLFIHSGCMNKWNNSVYQPMVFVRAFRTQIWRIATAFWFRTFFLIRFLTITR